MKLVLRPYQHVCIQTNENEILFYNIVKKKIYIYGISSKEYVLRRGNIIIDDENPNGSMLKSAFETELLGENIISSKIFCYNQYEILRRNYQNLLDDNKTSIFTDALAYVLQITAYIDNVLYPKKPLLINGCVPISNLMLNLDRFIKQCSNLQKVQFMIGELPLQTTLIADYHTTYKVEIFCSTTNIRGIKKLKQKYPQLSVTCIMNKETLNHSFISLHQPYISSFEYIVHKNIDFKIANTLPKNIKDSIQIAFSPYADVDVLDKCLFYYTKDICRYAPTNMKDIVENEFVNKLNWGKLIVNSEGEVYTSINSPGIGSLENIHLKELTNPQQSFWLKTRKQFLPCKDCIFQNLCPPLTPFETIHNQVYCHEK